MIRFSGPQLPGLARQAVSMQSPFGQSPFGRSPSGHSFLPRSPIIDKVLGNTSGLRAAQLKPLCNPYRRRLAPGSVTSGELARNLTELSHEIRREISLLIDRRGRVLSVSVADAKGVELPPVRRGETRLSGFHLLHTHPKGGGLSKGDLSALFLGRL
ncbi:MAG: GTPase HflX, partial [Deinococcus sp.]